MTRTQDYKMENKKLQDCKMSCATTKNIKQKANDEETYF
jgi:hypothetical protein